jgi:hypothetical protein
MPRIEEILVYLRGIWLLILGKPEGFGYLDLSERGFWRSWWSLLFCLPPSLLSYVALKSLLASYQPAIAMQEDFYLKLALMDYGSVFITTLIFFLAARIGGFGGSAIPIIIALNWLSVPLQWGFSFENLVQIYVPDSRAFTDSVEFFALLLTAFLSYRVIDRLVGGRALVTVTALLTLYVIPQLSQFKIAEAIGLLPDL